MSLNNDTTMLVTPANCYGNGGNGMWGGDWSSWIILFLIFGMFNGGWGFGGMGGGMFGGGGWGGMNGGVGSEVQRGFDQQAVISKLDGLTNGLSDATYALNNGMMTGFHGVDSAVCNLGYQTQAGFNTLSHQVSDCCCQTQRAVDALNYNMATQACDTRNLIQTTTRDVIDNQNQNARAVLDALTAQRIEAKDQTIAAQERQIFQLQLAASQAQQNVGINASIDAAVAEIIRRTGHGCPEPAYIVQPPTPVAFNGCGTGYAQGYGWGGGCGCNPCVA